MSEQTSIFDYLESIRLRDEGLALIADHNAPWLERALALIERAPYMIGPFESWRAHCLEQGLEQPSHANAWGALARAALQRRLLMPTGRWVKMRSISSHARRTPEYATC